MAKIDKPISRLIWASAAAPGDVIDPGDTKFQDGWQSEIPPFEYFNYLQQLFTGFIQYLNQEGIAEWDDTTEYHIGSYARSGAILYRSLIDDNLDFAVTDVSRWTVAFLVPSNNLSDLASAATARTNLSVYSKAETDAAYTTKANNLSDLASAATARTNLSVYSKTESDGKYMTGALDEVFSGSSASVDMQALVGGWPGDGLYLITNAFGHQMNIYLEEGVNTSDAATSISAVGDIRMTFANFNKSPVDVVNSNTIEINHTASTRTILTSNITRIRKYI